MSSFKRSLREKNTIVGDDANRVPIEMAKTSDECIAVMLLELVESAAIKNSRQNSVHVEWLFVVDRDDSIQVLNRVQRRFWLSYVVRILSIRIFSAEVLHDGTGQLNCMIFIMCQVVRDTRLMRMEIATSELLIGDNLARCSLDQRWSAKEDRALVLDNDYLVRHGWHVGSSSSA